MMIKLADNLYSNGPWVVEEHAYDRSHLDHRGSIFMVGNGYMGYRGTFSHDRSAEHVGCIISDTYDTADAKWRELVNAPNALYTELTVDEMPFRYHNSQLLHYRRGLDFQYGRWFCEAETETFHIHEERFSSYESLKLITSSLILKAKKRILIHLMVGIDSEVWNVNGNHFNSLTMETTDQFIVANMRTVESKKAIEVRKCCSVLLTKSSDNTQVTIERSASPAGMEIYTLTLETGDSLRCEQYGSMCASEQRENDTEMIENENIGIITMARNLGYDSLFIHHKRRWDALWSAFSLHIEGDPLSDLLLRYNMYQGIICAPLHSDRLPIGARGLSCQAYQGAAFWDQEIFNMPMFLHCMPHIARQLLQYRYATLDGARRKAEKLGYKGAFYAWVSADTGDEICPSYFFIDVLTKRKIRNHFNDWQIHISADIAYAIYSYCAVTGDKEFLLHYGAEMLFEIARFYCSRAHVSFTSQVAHLLCVLGPDEYHEGVDDNFYTNALVSRMCSYAYETYDWMAHENPEEIKRVAKKLALSDTEPTQWKHLAESLRYGKHEISDRVIEQFAHYFSLEDVSPEKLSHRLLHPHEYWGYPAGIAVETQVIKQADVLQWFMLYPDSASHKTIEKNWDYYEQRTQHGSSLSPAVYAITGSRIGKTSVAYDYFLRSCLIDIKNTNKAESGGTYIGGIHTASCGAAWQIVLRGFLGMTITEEGYRFTPHLPHAWKSVTARLVYHNQKLKVVVTPSTIECCASEENKGSVIIHVGDNRYEISPGNTKTISYEKMLS